MRIRLCLFLCLIVNLSAATTAHIDKPVIKGQSVRVFFSDLPELVSNIEYSGQSHQVQSIDGVTFIEVKELNSSPAIFTVSNQPIASLNFRYFPAWLSVLPPLLAILLAFLFKEVLISLFVGLITGVVLVMFYVQLDFNLFSIPIVACSSFLVPSASNTDHVHIILFSLMIAGMVNLMQKSGGMSALVAQIGNLANTRIKAQLATYFLGIAIFFDDYANTLIVGNTMQGLSDKFKISRAKLAYIVDSTAAPVASIAFVTTWVGAELSYIQSGLNALNIGSISAYSLFIHSIPYAFYAFFTLIFMGLLIISGKDFGPMYSAELKATQEAGVNQITELETVAKSKITLAIAPVLVLLLTTSLGLVYTGTGQFTDFSGGISQILGNANSYSALLWGSFTALLVAYVLTVSWGKISLIDAAESIIEGFKTMIISMVILILAWSLAEITAQLNTAYFLTSILQGNISLAFIPAVVFILSAITAFSTGSSWGTMAIVFPLVIPIVWNLGLAESLTEMEAIDLLAIAVGSVLTGAVLGDHCSPISDTTILSSMASGCNHITHVNTQMPYALITGGVSLVFGSLLTALGLPLIASYSLGILVLYGFIKLFGKSIG